mgnify:CR=1 FL=1
MLSMKKLFKSSRLILVLLLASIGFIQAEAGVDDSFYSVVDGITCTNKWLISQNLDAEVWKSSAIADNNRIRTAKIYRKPNDEDIKVIFSYSKLVDAGEVAAILIYDFATGNFEKEVLLNYGGEPITGLLCANQIGIDDFGHLWFSGFNSGPTQENPIKIYVIEDIETGACRQVGQCALPSGEEANAGRVDYCDVVGDITGQEANAVMMAAVGTFGGDNVNGLYRWELAQGETEWVANEEDFAGYVSTRDLVETYPEGTVSWGGSSAVVKIVKANASDFSGTLFYVDGANTFPALYDMSLRMLESFASAPDLCPALRCNGITEFGLGEKIFVVYAEGDYVNEPGCRVNICELGEGMTFEGMKKYWTVPENGLGMRSDGGRRQHCIDTYKIIDENGRQGVYLLTYKSCNGFGLYLIAEDGFVEPTNMSAQEPNYYVYLKNTDNWKQPYAFVYNNVDTCIVAFPGEPLIQQSNGLWKYEAPDGIVPTKIVFSNNGISKTMDLDYKNTKIYDCNGNIIEEGINTKYPAIQDIRKELIDSIVDWNDMSSPHQIRISGTYLNDAGDKGTIYYSVNNGDWIICTDTIAPGDTFNFIINPSFNSDYKIQSIRLIAKDIDNMYSVIDETIITNVNSFNVSGLNSMEYTGNAIELPGLIVTDPSTSLILTKDVDYSVEYSNNINAGTANTIIKGVYPNTIGTSIYNFKILPTPIDGTISFVVTDTTYVFNKCEICPEVKIYDNRFGELVKNKDYAVSYKNNIYPGNAYVYVNGLGNFRKNDSISTSFEIKRRDLTVSDIIVNVPENLMYDGDCHGIIITPIEGMGEYTITYLNEDSIIVDSIPSEPGIYSASLQISEGAYYNAINIDNIAQYTIYEANEDDWNALIALYNSTNGATWINTWNVANGIKAMSKLYGVTFDKGRVKSIVLPDNNLSGGIPAEIFSLPMLESLNLSKNLLTGNMPSITSSPIKNIDISNNALTGNIGEFISMLPNIERIKASNNCISQILPAFDKNNINVELNNQILNDTITLNMTSNASLLMSLYTIPNVITYNSDGAYRMALTTDKDSADFKLAMVYTNGQLQYNILSNSNVFTGKNGSYIHVVSNNPITEGSLITAQLLFTDGDADFSSSVNVLDVQALLLFTFKEFNVNPFNFTAANLYTDEIINVQDVVRLVNLLLAQEVSIPIESYSAQQNDAVVYWRGNELVLNTNKEVAAFEIVTTGATEMNWGVVRNGFTASSRQIDEYNRTIVYSLMGSTLPIGETVIATANDVNTPKVVNAILSSADAQSINVGCNRKDISSIEALEDKILSVHQEDNTLVLSSGEYLGNVECKVYSSDGTLLSLKKLDIVESGENVVIANYVKNNKVVFVHIISETAGNIVKKVIIK